MPLLATTLQEIVQVALDRVVCLDFTTLRMFSIGVWRGQ